MALCKLCSSVPFTSLPLPIPPYGIMHIWNELINIVPGDEEGPDGSDNTEPIGVAFHENLGALALSSKSCAICAIVQAGVQKRQDTLQEAWASILRASSGEPERVLRHLNLSKAPLWVTAPYSGAQGFIVWAHHPSEPRHICLVAAVGFSVDSGMYGSRSLML